MVAAGVGALRVVDLKFKSVLNAVVYRVLCIPKREVDRHGCSLGDELSYFVLEADQYVRL